MGRHSIRRGSSPATGALLAVAAGALLTAFVWPWDRDGPWPSGSKLPVERLGFPTVESRLESAPGAVRFAVLGDQRALADGEWQRLVSFLVEEDRRRSLTFVLDTGDIVRDGALRDQFAFLRNLLDPVSHLPYLICVGNHEVSHNRRPEAREHLATFLAGISAEISPDRFYFRKDVGPFRILFLDTSDLVYGDDGEDPRRDAPRPGSRAEKQLSWLEAELAHDDRGPQAVTIVAMHHPFLQSSEKHRAQAVALWSYRYRGRTLPDLLLDGGVDLVLSGHTHTTERFRVRREDGRQLRLLNVSGRPRDGFLWFGAGSRRARDLTGHERSWLEDHGWKDLDGWEIEQENAMTDDEADQCALLALDASGILELEMVYLRNWRGVRREGPVSLR